MKKLSQLILLSIILISCDKDSQDINSQNKFKRYDIKSGIVVYETAINGVVLQGPPITSTVSGSGQETVYFKDWGAVELREEKISTTSTSLILGTTTVETEEEHIMEKSDNGKDFSVNFDLEEIFETDYKGYINGLDLEGMEIPEDLIGEDTIDQENYYEIIGQESYKGYLCDVLLFKDEVTKIWLYKNFMLKSETQVLEGVISTKKAIKIEFYNDNIPNEHFKLPDYPITKIL